MNLIEKTTQLNALLDIVNSSNDFEGLIVSMASELSNQAGQNNMVGQPTFSLNFIIGFDAETDYLWQHGFFKNKTPDEIEKNWAWVFDGIGKNKLYRLMGKFYDFAKQQGFDVSWSYQRAFGESKKSYNVQGIAQGLLNENY